MPCLLYPKSEMAMIEPPDRDAALLRAKAAAQGLTLETWLKALVEREASAALTSPQQAAVRILAYKSA